MYPNNKYHTIEEVSQCVPGLKASPEIHLLVISSRQTTHHIFLDHDHQREPNYCQPSGTTFQATSSTVDAERGEYVL